MLLYIFCFYSNAFCFAQAFLTRTSQVYGPESTVPPHQATKILSSVHV
jgi:hypothetical protein